MARVTSWRDVARRMLGELLKGAVEQGLSREQFVKLLTDRYPWTRRGWAYASWLKERKICIEYFDLVNTQSLLASGFEGYSLAKLGQQDFAKQQKFLEEKGQLSLFKEQINE